MFCIHCGKQMEDGSRFCMYCGGSQDNAPVPPAAPKAPSQSAVIPSSQKPLDPQENYYAGFDPAPQYAQPAPQPTPYHANYYTDPVPPAPEKKKKKGKAGPIIAIVLVLLLLIGGGAGFYFYSQHVYEENLAAYTYAEQQLRKGDYDSALAAFEELGDFQDSQTRVNELKQLQKDYNKALDLLEDGKFEEARAAFQSLGDYRDSENFVEYEVDYRQALSLMASAEDAVDSDAITLYTRAAELFGALNTYADARDMASKCLLNAALIQLSYENYDEAMRCVDQLNTADASTLRAAYAELCSDDAFLSDVVEAMVIWLDDAEKYTFSQELLIAMEMMAPYEGVHFENGGLTQILSDFSEALEIMFYALDGEDDIYDYGQYYHGMYILYDVADTLYYDYGVFADDADLKSRFVGFGDIVYSYWKIEESLTNWWNGSPTADRSSDGHYYAAYTNDSGYAFTLYAMIYFYDANHNLLETSDILEIYVAKGATIYIPTIPETVSDDDWQTWDIEWDFDT